MLKRIYEDLGADYSTFEAFTEHYGPLKTHDTLTIVRVSTTLQCERIDQTFVVSKLLLRTLDCDNPVLEFGYSENSDEEESDGRRDWLDIRVSNDDDYSRIVERGEYQNIPDWLDRITYTLCHPTHVAIDVRECTALIQVMAHHWKTPYQATLIVPTGVWKKIAGAEITHSHYITQYVKLYCAKEIDESAFIAEHSKGIVDALVNLKIPETIEIGMLTANTNYDVIEGCLSRLKQPSDDAIRMYCPHQLDLSPMVWIATVLNRQITPNYRQSHKHRRLE